MIYLDLTLAACLLITVCIVCFVLGVWFSEKGSKKVDWIGQSQYLVECPLCCYRFYAYRQEDVQECPQCQHLISLDHIVLRKENRE